MKQPSYWKENTAFPQCLSALNKWIDPKSPLYLPVEERIAVFDLDGTMWCEKPYFAELFFVIDKLKEAIETELDEPDKQVLIDAVARAQRQFAGSGKMLLDAFNLAYPNSTSAEIEQMCGEWLDTALHTEHGHSYLDMIYLPVKEWIDALHQNQFACYVCTGSSEEFVRPWVEAVFGIPADRVLGSVLYSTAQGRALNLNIHDEKIRSVQKRCPAEPVIVVGNSDGDLELLEWISANNKEALCYLVDHDDKEREYVYPFGARTQASLDELGTLSRISMKEDWHIVFANQPPLTRS
ncbi:HAD family hydrolase [Vibrio nigripulchritudo]|uniref:HAD family hydrolase n=1 Tax=Vibrio nigripulchritudo TaxID=28173 RepID=UPI0005FA3E79|nr:HAD family hydrolase [Vibrio nigripulchritudo]KJY80464.1 hypothetical protein TW74_04885 [Vibrio nigripulchritudo]